MMPNRGRGWFQSVRGKTILYFSVVLSLAVILIGGICYRLFSRRYLSTLERQNNQRLYALAGQIDNQVFKYVERQFIELLQNEILYRNVNTFFRNPAYERNLRIYNAVQELRSLVTFSNGVIGSVDLYSPENGVSISSYTGYMNLVPEPVRTDLRLWEEAVQNRKDSAWWDIRQINSYQETMLVYFGAFPARTIREIRGMAAFAVAPSVFGSYLSLLENQDTRFYLFYEDLTPIYGSTEELKKSLSPEELEKIARTGGDGAVHGASPVSAGKVISYIRSSVIPAILVSEVSVAAFREEIGELFFLVLLIGLLVFLAGLAATGFVSQRLYLPLKGLVSSVSGLRETGGNTGPYRNEYFYINEAINNLYHKETEYRTALDGYISAIAGDAERALKALNLAAVSEALDHFRRLCDSLDYGGERCRNYCFRMGSVFSRCLLAGRAEGAAEIPSAESCENITLYTGKLRDAAGRAFEHLAGQNRQKALLMEKLLAYIGDNLSAPISQDSAAEHCGISAGYAGKLIKEETGETWVDYINNLRLDYALTLLGDPALKIEDAAKRAGFNSAAYFIKRFKKRYTLTPQAYRREFFNRH
jgi:AraC-like DNA-binding protein